MRFIFLSLLLLATIATGTKAKVFIHHTGAREGQEVWFHSNFDVKSLPDSAFLTLETGGYVLAYINGRVVGTQRIWPYRPVVDINTGQKQAGVASQAINVTHMLRIGRNALTVWYAPCIDMKLLRETPDTLTAESTTFPMYQLSAMLIAKKGLKTDTLSTSNSNWLCKIAPATMTLFGEDYNAAEYDAKWKNNVLAITPEWVKPEKAWYEKAKWNSVEDKGQYACNTITAKLNEKTDSMLTYYFPYHATGQLRVTIRGARKNQEIDINGMRYVCTGETDEQMFTRFSTISTDVVEIQKVGKDKLPNIQNLELIILETDKKDKGGF